MQFFALAQMKVTVHLDQVDVHGTPARHQVHGVSHLHPLQLWGQPEGGVPSHQTLQVKNLPKRLRKSIIVHLNFTSKSIGTYFLIKRDSPSRTKWGSGFYIMNCYAEEIV